MKFTGLLIMVQPADWNATYTSRVKIDLLKIDGKSPFWTSSNFLSHASNISTSIMSNTNGLPYLQSKPSHSFKITTTESKCSAAAVGTKVRIKVFALGP